MMMSMATASFKSTSGSVVVALVVAVLLAATVPETSAQNLTVAIVNVTFVNELDAPLKVTLPATAVVGTATQVMTIAARSDGTFPQYIQGPLLRDVIYLEVRGCVYQTPGSAQSRVASETGTVSLYVTGHCGTGIPGLQFVSTVAGVVCTNFACAAPVNPNCTGPIS